MLKIPRARAMLVPAAAVAGLAGLLTQRVLGLALDQPLAEEHAVGLLFGGLAAVAIARAPVSARRDTGLAAAGVFGLLLLFLPGLGVAIDGILVRLDFGLFSLDPRPFAKIAIIPLVARETRDVSTPRGLLRPMMVALPVALLLLLLPSFSTAFSLLLIVGAMLFYAGAPIRYFVPGMGVAWVLTAVMLLAEPARVRRVIAFLDPFAASSEAVGRWRAMSEAGFWGRGTELAGSLSQLARPADMEVSAALVIGGGIPALVLGVAPVAVLVLAGLTSAVEARTAAARLVVVGVALTIAAETGLHLSEVVGMVPPKSIVLPFLGAGPSGLVAYGVAVGLVLSALRGDASYRGSSTVTT